MFERLKKLSEKIKEKLTRTEIKENRITVTIEYVNENQETIIRHVETKTYRTLLAKITPMTYDALVTRRFDLPLPVYALKPKITISDQRGEHDGTNEANLVGFRINVTVEEV